MHVVCKNTDYEELQEALNHEDGLAVLAVMFEVGVLILFTSDPRFTV